MREAAHGPLPQRESRKHEKTKVRNVEKSMIFCLCFGLSRFRVFVMVLGCGLAAFIGGLARALPGAAWKTSTPDLPRVGYPRGAPRRGGRNGPPPLGAAAPSPSPGLGPSFYTSS